MADDIIKRMNYFDRQFLRAQDFFDEQAYHIDRQRRHNRLSHTPGIAEGLIVSRLDEASVTISPGTAIDPEGKQIVLTQLSSYPIRNDAEIVEIYILYGEKETDEKAEAGVEGTTRITEEPLFVQRRIKPDTPNIEPAPAGGVLLAKVELNNGNIIVDNTVSLRSGTVLAADLKVNSLALKRDDVDASQWPRLTSSQANEVTLEGQLKIDNGMVVTKLYADGPLHGPLKNPGAYYGTYTRHPIGLVTGNSEKLRIDTDGKVGIGTSDPKAKLDVSGNLKINGSFELPNTEGGVAKFTNKKFGNENRFKKNNIKLMMGSRRHMGSLLDNEQLIGNPFGYPFGYGPSDEYEFIIGHTEQTWLNSLNSVTILPTFKKVFSVNNRGDVYIKGSLISGQKAGYVIDYFINRIGEILEQGDVVIIGNHPVTHYCANNNDIPIPEVDLTDKVYDTRACGIVAGFVTDDDLPYSDMRDTLLNLTAKQDEEMDRIKVKDQQIGKMVTMGAFSYCKVDADIEPITMGDLLTTSPTKGHAQKVTEPSKAVGAIIGKALGSLKKGKGIIPVFVMLH